MARFPIQPERADPAWIFPETRVKRIAVKEKGTRKKLRNDDWKFGDGGFEAGKRPW